MRLAPYKSVPIKEGGCMALFQVFPHLTIKERPCQVFSAQHSERHMVHVASRARSH